MSTRKTYEALMNNTAKALATLNWDALRGLFAKTKNLDSFRSAVNEDDIDAAALMMAASAALASEVEGRIRKGRFKR